MKKKIKIRFLAIFWFAAGGFVGLFFALSFLYIGFEKSYKEKVYPGIKIANQAFAGKTKQEVFDYFEKKNKEFAGVEFSFGYEDLAASVSAEILRYGFNSSLLAEQAISLGRSTNPLTNLSIKTQALFGGLELAPSFAFSEEALEKTLLPLTQKLNIEPVEALFNFQAGRVIAFRLSSDGQEIDLKALKKELESKFPQLYAGEKQKILIIPLPVVVKKAKIQTADANNLGIKELIGLGTSRFVGSISNRVYNITLAASRLNGLLVAPGEVFSFNKALGDVSKFTGYKEAFIIQGGKTILGDGGGVCQVSTTLFRAILNSGLPIVERHPHSYRVGYYEQDSSPGIDATVYAPSVDLKFKNDTPSHVLVQAYTNPISSTLTFSLYGTSDNRKVTLGKPIITNQKPPPPPVYNDDPNLPRGVEKQIDFAAWGANVSFSRTVEKDGQIIISEKFYSNYQPWQAVYLRGTRE